MEIGPSIEPMFCGYRPHRSHIYHHWKEETSTRWGPITSDASWRRSTGRWGRLRRSRVWSGRRALILKFRNVHYGLVCFSHYCLIIISFSFRVMEKPRSLPFLSLFVAILKLYIKYHTVAFRKSTNQGQNSVIIFADTLKGFLKFIVSFLLLQLGQDFLENGIPKMLRIGNRQTHKGNTYKIKPV